MDSPLILPVSSASLVFGLDWLPLIGARPLRAGRRLARQHRATHLVVAGDSALAVGLARLKGKNAARAVPLHSAAQNVARMFGTGTVALILELDLLRYWLVAVHEGTVVARTDRIFGGESEARSALDELRQAFPQLLVLGDVRAPAVPGVQAIAAQCGVDSSLRPARPWGRSGPAWPGSLAALVLLAFLVPKAWMAIRPAAPQAASAPPDAGQAWRLALAEAGQGIAVHGVHGTRTVLDSLYRLPLQLAGWRLAGADCEPATGSWQCRGRYARSGAGATNEMFLQAAPGSWEVDFISIDQAEPRWRIPAAALPLDRAPVRSVRENERHLWSALQSMRTAFTAMQLGRPAALAMAVPRDAQGREVIRPPQVPLYTLRPVRFDGPLRSLALLLPHTAAIGWKKISLSLHDTRPVSLSPEISRRG